MSEGAMLRTSMAADYLGVSPATLRKWRVFGTGPRYKKLGRVVVYDPSELKQWLQAQSRDSTSQSAAERREGRAGRDRNALG